LWLLEEGIKAKEFLFTDNDNMKSGDAFNLPQKGDIRTT